MPLLNSSHGVKFLNEGFIKLAVSFVEKNADILVMGQKRTFIMTWMAKNTCTYTIYPLQLDTMTAQANPIVRPGCDRARSSHDVFMRNVHDYMLFAYKFSICRTDRYTHRNHVDHYYTGVKWQKDPIHYKENQQN